MTSPNAILEAWDRTLARRGNDAAILAPNGSVLRTFAQIEREAAEITGHDLMPLEFPAGCVVAVQLGNWSGLPGLLLHLWRVGCIPVLLDYSVEGPALDSALAVCQANVHFHWPAPRADALERRSGFSIRQIDGQFFTDDTQFLKLTSGTTDTPRAIRFTAAQLLADCHAVCDTMGLTDADVNYGVIPWSHSYGFSNLVTPLLCRGIPVVATEDRLPRAILDGLAQSGATVFPGLPVFFQKLTEITKPKLPRLRLCISAGAPLSAAVASAFRAQFGLKVHSFYGSSECGGIAYDASEDEVPEGCVGAPMRGVQIDFEDHEDLSRIAVRSAAVGEDYFPDSDRAVLGHGRFTPGDLVRRTPQGLVLAGRVNDFINIAGRKLNPAAVEAILWTCPGVREAVVFGVPHPHRGEEPIACVAGAASLETVQEHCAGRLPTWQIPRDFWFVENLPVNERGKLNRKALAESYQKSRATRS
jgi:long-chain acyl-CoA synthetase